MRQSKHQGAIFSADEAVNPTLIRSRLEEIYPQLAVQGRSRFKFAAPFVDDVLTERKTTTIRYTQKCVEYPACPELPIYRADARPGSDGDYVATVRIVGLCYKPFGDLTDTDATRDGFIGTDELKAKLRDIYGDIRDNEIVTIFAIASAAGISSNSSF